MTRIYYILFFLLPIIAIAQNNIIVNDTIIYNNTAIEKEAEFPGGTNELYKYIGENYNLTDDKNFKGGKIIASFVIEKNGMLSQVKTLNDIGFGTKEEIIRILNNSPLWNPAEENGMNVRVQYSLPITLQPSPVLTDLDSKIIYEYKTIAVPPYFPGGSDVLYRYIKNNYRQPSDGIYGKAVISFIIETDGSLTNFEILRDIGYGTSEELIKVLKNAPKWIPGIQEDQIVRCKYSLSINVEDGSENFEIMQPPTRPFNPFGPTKDRNGY